MDRVLVTGASGLLGANLMLTLCQRFDVVGAYNRNPVHFEEREVTHLDITDAGTTSRVIASLRPQIIIHCAAETNVDYCEGHPQEALRTNVEGTKNVALAADGIGAKVIYISTDSVYGGGGAMNTEESPPHPVNVYAQTKLRGEQEIQQHVPDHIIVRTNIYGWNARPKLSLAEWVLDRVERGQTVPGFVDIYFSPMLVNDLSDVLVSLIDSGAQGTYNIGARDRSSKFTFANMVCEAFGYSPEQVRPSKSGDAGLMARRPLDTSVNVRKVTESAGRPMPGIEEGLRRFRELSEEGYVNRLRSGQREEVARCLD